MSPWRVKGRRPKGVSRKIVRWPDAAFRHQTGPVCETQSSFCRTRLQHQPVFAVKPVDAKPAYRRPAERPDPPAIHRGIVPTAENAPGRGSLSDKLHMLQPLTVARAAGGASGLQTGSEASVADAVDGSYLAFPDPKIDGARVGMHGAPGPARIPQRRPQGFREKGAYRLSRRTRSCTKHPVRAQSRQLVSAEPPECHEAIPVNRASARFTATMSASSRCPNTGPMRRVPAEKIWSIMT